MVDKELYRKKYFGLYRGKVIANDDSQEEYPYLGRIKINVPVIYGDIEDVEILPWAWPCMSNFGGFPVNTQGEGGGGEDEDILHGTIAIPPVGSTVWVMFEQGEPNNPVYMGSWLSNERSMPQEAKQGLDGAVYPNIFIFKIPWRKNAYIRYSADKSFEIVYGDDKIKITGPEEEGGDDGNIEITAAKSNITIATTEGKLNLRGDEVNIYAKHNFNMYSGEWEWNEDTKEYDVITQGNIRIQASHDMWIYVQMNGHQGAIDKDNGEWMMGANTTSGYDAHDGNIPG